MLGGCVHAPVLTTDNIEKTHPWTSCDIREYTDTKVTDRQTEGTGTRREGTDTAHGHSTNTCSHTLIMASIH